MKAKQMRSPKDAMSAGQKAAHTKKWRLAAKRAHASGKNAKAFTRYLLGKHGYHSMSLDSRKGYEYKGVVDLVAVKRDSKNPDLLTIVLLQVKGGSARVTQSEIDRLRTATQQMKRRWNVAEKPKTVVKFRKALG
jgi:hypothetical protein